jgi:hypothetical protein
MCLPDSHFILSKRLLIVDQLRDELVVGFDLGLKSNFQVLNCFCQEVEMTTLLIFV